MARKPKHPRGANGQAAATSTPAPAATNGQPWAALEGKGVVPVDSLTPLPRGIHWRAAAGGGEGAPELEELEVQHFLDTLTQVALAAAARKLNKGKGETP
ncbi:MAG: hypothetical protein FJ316_10670 [SAR202 cluster bacterium]|nr:hypothetical protein [SAR202 cluster bacterium]